MSFNKDKALAVLAQLALSDPSRTFGACWLKLMSEKGRVPEADYTANTPAEIQACTVSLEVLADSVRIKSAGHRIIDAVGINLAGQDYLKMAPPMQRATRLARVRTIIEGHISTHQRWIVNSAGKLHVLNELAVPCGLSEDGLPLIMTYVETDSQGAIGHVSAKMGAMNIAPVFETYAIH